MDDLKDILLGVASFAIIGFDLYVGCALGKELSIFAQAMGCTAATHLFGAVIWSAKSSYSASSAKPNGDSVVK